MRTLLFTLEYPPFKGGVSKVYENIVKHWPDVEAQSFASNIFVLHNNDEKLVNNKLPFLKWLPSVFKLWKSIKQQKINYVLVGQILPLGTAAYIVSKFTGIKYSVILHGMDFTFALKTAKKKWLAGKILKNAENIICMNSYVGCLVREFVDDREANKIKIINPGVERMSNVECRMSNELIKKYNLEDKIILFSMGRLVKRKGVDMVLKVLPEALKSVPNLAYIIVGRGEELSNYQLTIASHQLQKDAIVITDADDEERNTWYNLCDIFIMPSRQIGDDFEGFGIVLMEASAAGKPVIGGRSGGVSDAVADGVSGILVNPESEEEIKNAIIKLAQDKDLREKLGKQGRERAEREFGWDKKVGEIFNLITRNMERVTHNEQK